MTDLLLIDGHSLAYRAFYAVPEEMSTSSGQVTNAVYGFTNMLINLLRDQRPELMAVAFDLPGRNFRHELDGDYKATRSKPPNVFSAQLGLIKEVLSVLGVSVLEVQGVEADDILATLSTQARDRERRTVIVTGDRDVFQLVEDPFISVLFTRQGVSNQVLYDEAGILERTGVRPADYVQYAAFRGDDSDNLPGVPKVGEKTAARLVNDFGGVDGVYANLDAHPPGRRLALAEAEQRVRLNLQMMNLRRDVELPVSVDDLTFEHDREELIKVFEFLEFNKLLVSLGEVLDMGSGSLPVSEPLSPTLHSPSGPADAARVLRDVAALERPVAVSIAPCPVDDPASVLGLVLAGAESEEVMWLPTEYLTDDEALEAFRALTREDSPPLAAHDSKEIMRFLLSKDVDVKSLNLDTAIAAYLLNPAGRHLSVGELLERQTEFRLASESAGEETTKGAGEQLSLGGMDSLEEQKRFEREAAAQALAVARLAAPMRKALAAAGGEDLHDKIEIPLVRVLARMEHRGIGVDLEKLRILTSDLEERVEELRKQVLAEAGEEKLNLDSPKQLGKVLFEKLGLTPQRKTKTGAFSTAARELEKLRGEHPVVGHLLDYREVRKLCSTYGHGLQKEVNPRTRRIHATFNQTVARTGRLSSDAPNLHNIPVRTETGKAFRGVFVAKEGSEFLVADYNQIELRCIAHLSGDPGLIQAFKAGEDVHRSTAAQVFGTAPEEVTYEQRNVAKMVAYGLSYGMEAYGLSERLHIPTEEAQEILNSYFEAFPGVRQYMGDSVDKARERGYTETLFGRRRPIPELRSENVRIRQAAERQAMNAGIQGLAADIFKAALVHLDRSLEIEGLESQIILQVHDEVILEVPFEERAAADSLVHKEMEGACQLEVPLAVDMSFGRTWLEAKN